MMTFLLTILVLYLLYKATPWLLAWWVRRQHRKFQQQMGETREREARSERQERTSHIEDNAEDAEYQEIAGPRETVTQEAFTAEEQVIDAEFEDI